MSVCFGVIVRTRINQRCVCVSSGVLVRSAPCDPGVCVLSPLCRSASGAGFSDGAVPRRLCGQKPLQHANDDRFLQKRLQMPSGNPHCIYPTQGTRNGQQRACLRQCQHCISALFRRLAISPSRLSVGPFTPPLHRHHRTPVPSLRRAGRIRSFFGPALRIRPFFRPPPPPFFAPARRICPFLFLPLCPHPHAMQVARYSRLIFSSMRSTSFPVPPPRPLPGVKSSLIASAGLRCRFPSV